MRGHKVELVTEYAKELTYEKNWEMLKCQDLILPEQYNRQKRLVGHVDFIITDSPLPLNLIYARDDLRVSFGFWNRVLDFFDEFDNFNVMIKRVKPYSHYGRKETDTEAVNIDSECVLLLNNIKAKYHWVRGDEDSPVIIYNMLFNNYEIKLNEVKNG